VLIGRHQGVAYGVLYDNLATCTFDLGCELDNYHGLFSSYRAEGGDLDYYFIAGPRILDVTRRVHHLIGGTLFGPRWSLGYSGSSMAYTDAADPVSALEGFLEDSERHEMECSSFHLSSGYTLRGGKRYVFHWNRDRVPQPQKLIEQFHRRGVRVAANIKPMLLDDHPDFARLRDQGLFIRDSEDPEQPALAQVWDGEGAHLDFTHPETRRLWGQQVKKTLLDVGVDATWNDNNEFEIWDEQAKTHIGVPLGLLRPIQTLLMLQTSYVAQRAARPTERPWLISRSVCPGMQRYAQTWSGDNLTSWETLRDNTAMGLGASLSGLFNIGHDVGGFSGPAPDGELLRRWVQTGVFFPRFVIHSWNEDGSVTEPWMHPAERDVIREALEFRQR
ncbi:MAG: TIM-barrel domain-containing protein, partial [Myxococcota bacterium]